MIDAFADNLLCPCTFIVALLLLFCPLWIRNVSRFLDWCTRQELTKYLTRLGERGWDRLTQFWDYIDDVK